MWVESLLCTIHRFHLPLAVRNCQRYTKTPHSPDDFTFKISNNHICLIGISNMYSKVVCLNFANSRINNLNCCTGNLDSTWPRLRLWNFVDARITSRCVHDHRLHDLPGLTSASILVLVCYYFSDFAEDLVSLAQLSTENVVEAAVRCLRTVNNDLKLSHTLPPGIVTEHSTSNSRSNLLSMKFICRNVCTFSYWHFASSSLPIRRLSGRHWLPNVSLFVWSRCTKTVHVLGRKAAAKKRWVVRTTQW